MRELLYLSTAKLRDFHRNLGEGKIGKRPIEVEASLLGNGARVSMGEESRGDTESTLEEAISYIREVCWANTKVPESCQDLKARDWVEFTDDFYFGPVWRDSGEDRNRGVYAYASREDAQCMNSPCSGIELLLCGSLPHVMEYSESSPTRMGSRTEWVHDLIDNQERAELSGDTSIPESVLPKPFEYRAGREKATRYAYDMLSGHLSEGIAYLHGHARVLLNFPPGEWNHRLILATPLYVETALRPPPDASVIQARAERRRLWSQLWRR